MFPLLHVQLLCTDVHMVRLLGLAFGLGVGKGCCMRDNLHRRDSEDRQLGLGVLLCKSSI